MSPYSTPPRPQHLAERTIAEALRSFALPLGCPVGYLERPRALTVERMDAAPVVHTFARNDVAVVSLPSADLELDPADVQELIALTQLEAAPGSVVELRSARLTVGAHPATVAIIDEQTIEPQPFIAAAIVYEPTAEALDQLRFDVSPDEWMSAAELQSTARGEGIMRVGAMSGGVLVALATVEPGEGRLARIRVLVSPTSRRRGLGRLVLHALVKRVLQQGMLPYARLAANDLRARALARAVGFVSFARALTLEISALRTSAV
jgi:GNAT superfamily N-acetyltransferase